MVASLTADPTPPLFDDTHTLSSGHHIVNLLFFGCKENRNSSITIKQNQAVLDDPLSIAVTCKPIMRFVNLLKFWMSFQQVTHCKSLRNLALTVEE